MLRPSPNKRHRKSLTNTSNRRLLLESLENRSLLAAIVAPNGIVSWWTGDNTTADLLGRNDAALFNGGAYASGNVGSGFNFDGVDDNLQASTAGLPTGSADRTIELWVRIDQQVANEAFFASYGAPGSSNQVYALGTQSNGRLFVSTWGPAVFGPTLQNNRWYHVAATNVGTSFKLYLDGAQVASGTMPVDTPADSTFWMGRQTMAAQGDNRRLDGMVDEVSVYNRALTATEINAIYSAGSAGKIKSPVITADFPSVVEGPSSSTSVVTATIGRVGNVTGQAIVNWTTVNGSATAGLDYVAASGQVVLQDGQSQQTVQITVNGDDSAESNETIKLLLSTTSPGYQISNGLATIQNDDFGVSISDAVATEGDHTAHYRGALVDGYPSGHFNPLTFGPDGNVYTAVGTGAGYNTIQKFDGTTGEFLGTFMDNSDPLHKINGVRDIVFHPTDGNVYVASAYTDEVLRYSAQDGSFVDVFVSANSGGIEHPDGMMFGPDSNNDGKPELYVTGWLSHSVVRYDGATGLPLGNYITSGSGGLNSPFSLAFNGSALFVTSAGTNQILKYWAATGAYLGVGASTGLSGPRGITFDSDNVMYVTSGNNDRILRFTSGGTYVDDYVTPGAGGMDNPRTPRFGPDGDLYVTSTGNREILRFGTEAEAVLTVSLSSPSSLPINVDFTTEDGTAVVDEDYAFTTGTLTFAPGVISKTILIPTLDDTAIEANETFSVNLSNAAGAIIVDGTGVATIIDNDTKFYVVNDGSTAASDKTFEYGTGGPLSTNAGEDYNLATANTAPRGAASTAAGDKVWIVDANKNVYVYNTSGGLVGSWLASGLSQPTGIATNGTDIWIVDASADKTFKYTGAASRLTGSQNPANNQSFKLNSGNKDASDLVTDGTSIWVLNNTSSTDKVFKYNASNGALQGSWTIQDGGGSPTGITIDPSGSSQSIWIVDSTTDEVYEYTNARSKTSGSQSAAATFLLAAGNTNPQGIADPPPPSTMFDASSFEAAPPASAASPRDILGAAPQWAVNAGASMSLSVGISSSDCPEDLSSLGLAGSTEHAQALDRLMAATAAYPFSNLRLLEKVPAASARKVSDDVSFDDDLFETLDDFLMGLLARRS